MGTRGQGGNWPFPVTLPQGAQTRPWAAPSAHFLAFWSPNKMGSGLDRAEVGEIRERGPGGVSAPQCSLGFSPAWREALFSARGRGQSAVRAKSQIMAAHSPHQAWRRMDGRGRGSAHTLTHMHTDADTCTHVHTHSYTHTQQVARSG